MEEIIGENNYDHSYFRIRIDEFRERAKNNSDTQNNIYKDALNFSEGIQDEILESNALSQREREDLFYKVSKLMDEIDCLTKKGGVV